MTEQSQSTSQDTGYVRSAAPADVPAMIALAEEKRVQYVAYQPRFHRPAPDAREQQTPFFGQLVADPDVITLVHERDGAVDGFVIAMLIPPPPVYEPGGPTCVIDDFHVAGGQDWAGAGRALLDEAVLDAKARGAVQAIVICGPRDERKRALLSGGGYDVVTEWFLRDIGDAEQS
jgi:hypothetical protein